MTRLRAVAAPPTLHRNRAAIVNVQAQSPYQQPFHLKES
jgi:hypothetical protein